MPIALAGSLALSLTAVPANAAETKPREGTRQGSAFGITQRTAAVTTATTVRAEAAEQSSYVVQQGDTLTSIAIRHGLRTVDLLTWNGLSWSSVITPGQKLVLTSPTFENPEATAPVAENHAAATVHTVQAGETLWSLSQLYGVSAENILASNGLGADAIIYPGQQLTIPNPATPDVSADPPSVPAPDPAPEPDPAPAPSPGGTVHVVEPGETLWSIAAEYGVSIDALFAANGLTPTSIIYPGQELIIPDGSGETPAAVPDQPEQPQPEQPQQPSTPPQLSANLDSEQTGNAQLIIQIGREIGAPERAIAIALATAMVESSLRNLNHGADDSLGLFQQRPSAGWGTPAQIRNADRSTRVFYGGPSDPNGSSTRGLLDIPGWEGMAFTEAAQAVQVSAYPDRYGQWEQQAFQWIEVHG